MRKRCQFKLALYTSYIHILKQFFCKRYGVTLYLVIPQAGLRAASQNHANLIHYAAKQDNTKRMDFDVELQMKWIFFSIGNTSSHLSKND